MVDSKNIRPFEIMNAWRVLLQYYDTCESPLECKSIWGGGGGGVGDFPSKYYGEDGSLLRPVSMVTGVNICRQIAAFCLLVYGQAAASQDIWLLTFLAVFYRAPQHSRMSSNTSDVYAIMLL